MSSKEYENVSSLINLPAHHVDKKTLQEVVYKMPNTEGKARVPPIGDVRNYISFWTKMAILKKSTQWDVKSNTPALQEYFQVITYYEDYKAQKVVKKR